jgi:hypothetical protein
MEYQEIEFNIGSSIEDAFNKLQDHSFRNKTKACGKFNNVMLDSDDTLDSAYVKIIGMTYNEFREKEKKRQEEYEQRKKEHKEAIPELTREWVAKGKEILHKDKWQKWEYIVPIRLSDMYEGMELKACLDIIKILREEGIKKTKQEMYDQGHSGTSFYLVLRMVEFFYEDEEKAKEFVEAVK